MARNRRGNELEILKKINNMDDDELKKYRIENKTHDDKIAQRTIRNIISKTLKRIIDLIAGLIGTIFLIPITLIIWILSKVNKENGPLFYSQERIGKDGKIFKMYKFRTMIENADELLDSYLRDNPEEAKEYAINKKLSNDPRITKTGKILRKLSLDEWPQFIAILFNKMSLVGPRPYLPKEKEDMKEYYKYIIKVKPGLTGPWQIAGRNNLTFEERLKLDEEYVSRCGNKRDLIILFKTFKKVFNKEGAI